MSVNLSVFTKPKWQHSNKTLRNYIQRARLAQSVLSLSYRMDDTGFDLGYVQGLFVPFETFRLDLGPAQPPLQWVPGFFRAGKLPVVKLIIRLHLQLRLRKSASLPPSPNMPSWPVLDLILYHFLLSHLSMVIPFDADNNESLHTGHEHTKTLRLKVICESF
jgi:hypothetical protein